MDIVSIVVPVYNVEKFLKECLDSICTQTYTNLEIILIDDGSTDSSGKICDDYAKLDKRIKIFHNKNYGVSYSRNLGIKEANGKYIVFIDSDDVIESNYIEISVEMIKKDNSDIVIVAHDIIDELLNKKEYLTLPDTSILTGKFKDDYYYLANYLITPWGKLYKLDIIKYFSIYFPEDFVVSEDRIFNYMYFKFINKYTFINKLLYHYFRRGNISLSKNMTQETFIANVKRLEIQKNFFWNFGIKNKEKILINDIIYLLKAYIPVEKENKYNFYKKRVKLINKILKNEYEVMNKKIKNKKVKILIYLLKNNYIFPIYVYNKIKRIINKNG